MKTNKLATFAVAVAVMAFGFAFVFVACSNDETIHPEPVAEKLKFENFREIGRIHNLFLTNVQENFEIDPAITTREAAIESINRFNLAFAEKLDIPEEAKLLFRESLEQCKRFANFVDLEFFHREFYSTSIVVRNGREEIQQAAMFEQIDEVYSFGLIDSFERNKLTLLAEKTEKQYEGKVSLEELQLVIADIIVDWESQGYTKNCGFGQILAYVLSISEASMEWWLEEYIGYMYYRVYIE